MDDDLVLTGFHRWACRRKFRLRFAPPYSAARRAWWATSALATSVFVGVHPVLTQVPPKRWRSTTATVIPAAAKRAYQRRTAWPAPMTMASNVLIAAHGGDFASFAEFMLVRSDSGTGIAAATVVDRQYSTPLDYCRAGGTARSGLFSKGVLSAGRPRFSGACLLPAILSASAPQIYGGRLNRPEPLDRRQPDRNSTAGTDAPTRALVNCSLAMRSCWDRRSPGATVKNFYLKSAYGSCSVACASLTVQAQTIAQDIVIDAQRFPWASRSKRPSTISRQPLFPASSSVNGRGGLFLYRSTSGQLQGAVEALDHCCKGSAY